jgi:hypothetical protein
VKECMAMAITQLDLAPTASSTARSSKFRPQAFHDIMHQAAVSLPPGIMAGSCGSLQVLLEYGH